MRLLYNILFPVFFCLSAPFYFLKMWRRGNWRQGFGQRFGRFDPHLARRLEDKPVVWFHAVSVGEVNVCTQLVRQVQSRLPGLAIVVSTTTSTGMGELRRKLPDSIERIYYPVDFLPAVRRTLRILQPRAIVLVEAEIWPNLLWSAQDRQIPVFLVNARLSEKSFRGYRRFGALFRPLFAGFSGVGCQNRDDAARLAELGTPPQKIQAIGNMKFDATQAADPPPLDARRFLERLGVPASALVIVGGSTHAGEEVILADMVLELKARFPGLLLILVPRHFERSDEVEQAVRQRGLRVARRTKITGGPPGEGRAPECLLVDTTGELRAFYDVASVVFVGKSLTAHGGQNPIEPAVAGRAMVFGPNMQNFASIVRAFREASAVVQVRDAPELLHALGDLLADPAKREALGRRARDVVAANRGAVDRTADMLCAQLAHASASPPR